MIYENVIINFNDGVTVTEKMHAVASVEGDLVTVIAGSLLFQKNLSEVDYFSSNGKELKFKKN